MPNSGTDRPLATIVAIGMIAFIILGIMNSYYSIKLNKALLKERNA